MVAAVSCGFPKCGEFGLLIKYPVEELLHTSLYTPHFNKQRQNFHQAGASKSFCLRSCQNETDLNWLKNQVKVVGEKEILASLVEFKHHSMAEMIRNEKEEKKLKPRGQV